MKPRLYYAAPLFSQAERAFNEAISGKLEIYFDVYLPQRDGGLFTELVSGGMDIDSASIEIFTKDIQAIRVSDVVLIVLDGRVIDEGAAFELGYAHANGKVCIGLQTDSRRLLPIGNNPMVNGPLINIFTTIEGLLTWSSWFAKAVATKAHEPSANQINRNESGLNL